MDKLDKVFRDHHDLFDSEPNEGHLQRFEAKLNQQHRQKIGIGKSFLKIASLVIILLLSANLFVYLLPAKKAEKGFEFKNTELSETAHFYNARIASGLSQLKQMANQGIGSEQELLQVEKELNEMDQLHKNLQKEYSENPEDERVVNAMIEYYQTKLEIINTIKSDLELVKSIKNKKDENASL